jgi:hypothetical protein
MTEFSKLMGWQSKALKVRLCDYLKRLKEDGGRMGEQELMKRNQLKNLGRDFENYTI